MSSIKIAGKINAQQHMHATVLRYVIEVARLGSIRKAGAALNVASSGINRQILRLEDELGVRIFERTPDGVRPTEAGKLILTHAAQTLQNFEKLRPQISNVRDLRAGHISITSIDSLTFRILPEIIEQFATIHPGVTVTVRQAAADDVVQIVDEGYADIGFTFEYFERQSVRPVKLISSPRGLVVSPDHPLAGRQSVTLEECLQYRLVKHYDPNGKHIFLDEIATRESREINAFMFTNSTVLAKKMIAQGRGVGVYIKHGLIDELAEGVLKFIPIDHPNLSAHRLGIFIPANRFIDSIDRKFVDIAEEVFTKYA